MEVGKKAILYIGGFELPDKNAASHRVIANAKILNALGYDVLLIGVDKTNKKINNYLNKKIEGFTYYNVKYPKTIFEWLNYLTSIKPIINLENIHPTHIIAYNYPSFALERLRKYCLKKKIFLLGDCTEWYEPKGRGVFRIIKGLDVFLRMRIIHPKLDGLIVISKYLFNYYKPKNCNLIQIPPLVDLTMGKWEFTHYSTKDQKINLVYAGSPGSGGKDRLDKIINVVVEINKQTTFRINLNIIGITKLEYFDLFVDDIIPQNIDEYISFKGRFSHVDTLSEVNKADYQIFVRDKNLTNMAGFPTKFVESISCGTPVLTNSLSNIEEYFIPGKMGFLLDISSTKNLRISLIEAITKSRDSIQEMKNYCKSNQIFDYRNFIKPFFTFLDDLNSKSI